MNRDDRDEVQRYVSGGDPEFFDEDFAEDDIVDPVALTPAEVAELDRLISELEK